MNPFFWLTYAVKPLRVFFAILKCEMVARHERGARQFCRIFVPEGGTISMLDA